MIVDIKKGNRAKGLIDYHEKKVEQGRGERIMDTTFSDTKERRISRIEEIAALNSRLRTNKFLHLSISFNRDDHVTREQQLQIADLYLEGMGYSNTPRLMYEHYDTTHRHFHIVTTTIDFDGKKIPEFRDYERSQLLSRGIEKQFGLKVTVYKNKKGEKLQEINARRYRLLKGFEKLVSNAAAQEQIFQVIAKDELDQIMRENWSDKQIKALLDLRENPRKKLNDLYRILRLYNAEYKTDKDMLVERLDYIKQLSSSREDFLKRVESQGIYVRKIMTGPKSTTVTFGLADRNFYVNDTDLPLALRYDYLFSDKKVQKRYDIESQKKFMKRMVNRSFNNAVTFEDFQFQLRRVGVKYEFSENKRGIYGISFTSENLHEAHTFKGSEVGLSWNTIVEKFELAPKKTSVCPSTTQTKPSAPIYISKSLARSLDTSSEDEDQKRKNRQDLAP